jgi:hypothetical protein
VKKGGKEYVAGNLKASGALPVPVPEPEVYVEGDDEARVAVAVLLFAVTVVPLSERG